MNSPAEKLPASPPTKLDLGCGPNKKPGFWGVDSRAFPGVDEVVDLNGPWPWDTSSIEEIHMSHTLEHFEAIERVHVLNEMWRVLKNGGTAFIVTPYWCSNRAFGDFTHKWPPVCEMLYFYLDKTWRASNAPHNDKQWNPEGYDCDFLATWNYNIHPTIALKHGEALMFALSFYKEAAQDLVATITARK